MTGRHEEEGAPVKRSSITVNLQFMIYLVTLLVGIGVSIGTFQLTVSNLRAEQESTKTEVKEIRATYMRTDLFEARQRGLENQLNEIGDQVREIKTLLLKRSVR